MSLHSSLFKTLLAATCLAFPFTEVASAEGEVNVYSARHYDTDEHLYSDFTEATGIKVNLIEAGSSELMERLKAEGANSPADVVITTDAGRLYQLESQDLLQDIQSLSLIHI